MATPPEQKPFLGSGPLKDHGEVRQSVFPEADTPMKPEADRRRGPGLDGIAKNR